MPIYSIFYRIGRTHEISHQWLNKARIIAENKKRTDKILHIEETVVGDDMRMFQAEIALEQSKTDSSEDLHDVKSAFIKSTRERIAQRLEIVNRIESELWVEVPLSVPQEDDELLKPGEKRQDNAELFPTSKWVRRSELESCKK